tara:strand:+ start:8067 stop:8447 length:381 start_codon:yes stop_codon:yes gene_type:complete
METPDNLRYSTEHEWVRLEGDIATMGITDFAQSELGDIVFVELPSEGDNVSEMGVFGAVEAVKTVSDLYSPLGGEVIEVNYELEDNPEMVNQEPYGNGWMIKIRVENMGAFTSLMQANDYRSFIGV